MKLFYQARHTAVLPKRNRRRIGKVLPMVLAFLVMTAGIALADDLVVDGDGLVPVASNSLSLGNICLGQSTSGNAMLAIRRSGGSNNSYANNATPTVTVLSASSSLSATLTDNGVSLPNTWQSAATNAISADTAAATVTLSNTAPVGPFVGTVVFRASGPRASDGATLNKDATLNVTASVIACDTTPPVISANVGGTLGNNGWYTSDVNVSWSVTDAESAISSSSGCDPVTIDADTDGQTLTCSATSLGGTSEQSVTIKRDATAPTISGAALPVPNGAGWNNSDVTVSFICADNLSGLASCGSDQTLTSDGAGQSVSGSAVDNAGNSASSTVGSINIDKTAPSVSASASPAANSNGWNNGNVIVSFSGTDGGSGMAGCDSDVTLSSEASLQSASGSCTDLAGNSASATASGISIDKTAPSVSASVSPAPNANGWNNGNVTVSFNGTDGGSGIDTCSAPVVISSEGAGQSASGSCTDKAGNSASASASNINVDKTAPSVSLVGGPAHGESYFFGFVPAAPTCSATDALSGLNGTCSPTGYGTSLGSHTVSASASDRAGNSASASATYSVGAWTLSGFFSPVDMGFMNTVKGGSTVPLKFRVFAATELTETTVVKTFQAVQKSCSNGMLAAEVEELAPAGSTVLRYDTTSGHFIYNWKTPKLPGKCYQVTLTTQDGSTVVADFQLK